jgi:hypothetical protein
MFTEPRQDNKAWKDSFKDGEFLKSNYSSEVAEALGYGL